MLSKLKSILPEKIGKNYIDKEAEYFGQGWNECLNNVEALLPDMLALIREEIKKVKNPFICCYGKNSDCEHCASDIMKKDILNILK
jgi:hypothetical protein